MLFRSGKVSRCPCLDVDGLTDSWADGKYPTNRMLEAEVFFNALEVMEDFWCVWAKGTSSR